ncbi:MAG: response regulator, partial [bacterium]
MNMQASINDIPYYGKYVLVVEEDEDMRNSMATSLLKEGFYVLSTNSGKKAIRAMNNHMPELVITCVDLPDMNGLDLCKWLKKQERFRDIPVLIVSNRKELQDRINGFLAGAKRYICKPFEMADLLKHAVFHTRNSEISS